jgi:uncharacterized protein (DUF58 family)
MTVPTRRAVLLLAGGFPLALLPALVRPGLWPLWMAALATTAAAFALDALLGVPAAPPALQARAPAVLHVGEDDVLHLEIGGGWRQRTLVEVLCDFDETLEPQPAAHARAGRTPARAATFLRPRRRGRAAVRAVWLRWKGPLGLLQWTERRPLDLSIPVLPNVRAVRGAALRFFGSRQFLSGLKVERHLGDGTEFESLREHRAGEGGRAIDWKASARHHRMLSREYRAERNHAVVLAVDTGHLMVEPLLGIPKLDHAINASLLLAYVALKTGDRVGLFAFDDGVRHYIEPQGGVHSFGRLVHATSRLAYSTAETNFTLGLLDLGQRLRRRSLVVVLTDFVDTVTAELMVENLGRLGRGHRVVFVALRDVALDALAAQEPRDLDQLNRAVTAGDLGREREVVVSRLRRQGVLCVDGAPGAISAALVNRYLDLKRREMV